MTDKAISPLRRRLIEDMTIRRLSPKTQLHYIRHVKRFADFLGRSADKATAEDVHRYRPASALPIFASVHCFPVGETARAPFFRQRNASGISAVTHTSIAPMRSAIQSSVASALSPTITMLTFGLRGGRIDREPLQTRKTLSRSRLATR